MALKLGNLYVSLTANTDPFSKSLGAAMKAVEKFAKHAKRAAAEVASMSAVLAGVGIAAIKLAAGVDGPTKTALDGMERSTKLLAVQIADMLLPAVRELTAIFNKAAEVVAGLSPELKKQISHFAEIAVAVAVGAKALSMFSGLVANVAGILSGAFAIGLAPILAVVSAIALVVAAVVVLHYAFRTNLGGIADMWKRFSDWLSDTGAKAFNALGDFAFAFADGFLSQLRDLASAAGKFFNLMGNGDAEKKAIGIYQSIESARQQLAKGGLKGLATQALEFAKELGTKFGSEVDRIVAEVKKALGGGGKSKPIALGRGMGPTVGTMDTSSMGTMAWFGGMQAAAAEGEGAMTAIAVKFSAAEISANEAAMAAQAQADSAKAAQAAAAEFAQKMAAVGQIALAGFTRALGAVGELVNAAVEGAKSGGPWGAVVAVFMEILQKVASAMAFVGTAMAFVKQVAGMLEPLVKPIFDALSNLLGGILNMIGPLFQALQPLFDGIAAFIGNLGPVIDALGYVIAAISPIIEFIAKIIGGILKALKPVLDLIAGVVKVIATVVLGIVIFLNEIAAAFGDKKARAESDRLKKMIDEMWQTPDAAAARRAETAATLRNTDAQNDAADAAKKVSESLSNIPAGYNIANARYMADMGITSANSYRGGVASHGGKAPVFSGGDIDSGDTSYRPPAGGGSGAGGSYGSADEAYYGAYGDAIAQGLGYYAAVDAGNAARDAYNAAKGGGGSQKSTGTGSGIKTAAGSVVSGAGLTVMGDVIVYSAATSIDQLAADIQRAAGRARGQITGTSATKNIR